MNQVVLEVSGRRSAKERMLKLACAKKQHAASWALEMIREVIEAYLESFLEDEIEGSIWCRE